MITASQATPSRQSESKHFAGTHWAIDSHYQLLKRLGCGVQGVVVSALDLRGCGSPVAIKKVDTPQLKEEARRVLREIRLMRCLTHPNVLRLLDVMISDDTSSSLSPQRTGDGATQPAGDELDYSSTTTAASSKPHRRRATFREVYIVTELMSTDLRRILSIANQPASTFELRAEQVQYLLYQLLCGVHYIGSAGVLHRDLKPSNLLIDLRTCQLRICDFGLARALPLCDNDQAATTIDDDTESDSATMTEYVVTRHYRAPELLLGVRYGVGVDAWSVGCVLAELLAPRSGVLFKGTERRTMLACIAQLVGRPDDQHLGFVTNPHARQFLLSIPTQPTTSLRLHLAKFRWSGCEISTSAVSHVRNCCAILRSCFAAARFTRRAAAVQPGSSFKC